MQGDKTPAVNQNVNTKKNLPRAGKKSKKNIVGVKGLVVAHARRHAAHSTHSAHATGGHTAFG